MADGHPSLPLQRPLSTRFFLTAALTRGLVNQEPKTWREGAGERQEALTQLYLQTSTPQPRWPLWCQPLMSTVT